MNPRLLILFVAAAVLAIVVATRVSKPTEADDTGGDTTTLSKADQEDLVMLQTPLSERDLPGEEPAVAPKLDVQVEVDQISGKNRLLFSISEANGYYVETFQIDFWYKETPDMEPEDAPLRFEHFLDKYVKANETFQDCLEVVPAELASVGGSIGTSENWGARIASYRRAREANPDPLPLLSEMNTCN